MNTIQELAAPRVIKRRNAAHRKAIGGRLQPADTVRISLSLDGDMFRKLLDNAIFDRVSVAEEIRRILEDVMDK